MNWDGERDHLPTEVSDMGDGVLSEVPNWLGPINSPENEAWIHSMTQHTKDIMREVSAYP